MAAPIRIRPVVVSDAAAIHAMLLGIARHVGKPDGVTSTVADIARHGFGPRPEFSALIAERDGAPLGLSLFFPTFSTWRGEPGLYVQDLYVDPAARGTGLGRRLLAATAAWGARTGRAHLVLAVDAVNDAHEFYRRLGFTPLDESSVYRLAGPAFVALAGLAESIAPGAASPADQAGGD